MKRTNIKRYTRKAKKAKDFEAYRKEMNVATEKMLKDIKDNVKIILR